MPDITPKPPSDPLASAARQIRPEPQPVERDRKVQRAEGSGLWMPPLFLGSVLLGVMLLLRRPDGLWAYVVGGVFVIVFGWFLVSTLWPGRAERTCPACSKEGLTRLDANSHRGLRCTLCGFEDETSSCFFLAEEEGTLEDTVMRERGRVPQWADRPGEDT